MVGREDEGEEGSVLFGETERRFESPFFVGLGGNMGLGDSK